MKRVERLARIAGMIADAKLADVSRADLARRESLAHLDALQVGQGADDPVSAQVALRYERWADARRAEINLTLARQTADWLDAQDRARLAFGRAEVLRKLR